MIDLDEAAFQQRPELRSHLAYESFVSLASRPRQELIVDRSSQRRTTVSAASPRVRASRATTTRVRKKKKAKQHCKANATRLTRIRKEKATRKQSERSETWTARCGRSGVSVSGSSGWLFCLGCVRPAGRRKQARTRGRNRLGKSPRLSQTKTSQNRARSRRTRIEERKSLPQES